MSFSGTVVEGNHGGANPCREVNLRSKYVFTALKLTLWALDSMRPPTMVTVPTVPLVANPQMLCEELDVQLELIAAMLASISTLWFE